MPENFVPGFENVPSTNSVTPDSQAGSGQNVGGANPVVDGSNSQQRHEEAVPYTRFQEVNQRASQAEATLAQTQAALNQLLTQQATANGQSAQQAQQTANQQTGLLTDDEMARFSESALIDPGRALQEYGQILSERTVTPQIEKFRQEMQNQLAQERANYMPFMQQSLTNTFVQRHLSNPDVASVRPVFDKLVTEAQANAPHLVQSEQGLQLLLQNAIGQSVMNGTYRVGNAARPAPFSESASPANPFSSLGAVQAPTIPQAALEYATKMGVDPAKAAAMYQQMEAAGVFQNQE